MHKALVIDTSIIGVSLAVCEINHTYKVISKRHFHERFGSAGKISEYAALCFQEAGWVPEQVSHCIISQGPGSFTGIKVGLSWAMGFAACHPSLLWLGIPAIDGLCYRLASRFYKPVLVLLPATRTHGFMSYRSSEFETPRSCLIEFGQNCTPLGEFDVLCREAAVYLARSWELLEIQLATLDVTFETLHSKTLLESSLDGMLEMGMKFHREDWSTMAPSPRYLRKSTAEERFGQKKEKA